MPVEPGPGWWTVALTVVAVATVAAPASAHTNHVEADPQVAAEGTILVEGVYPAVQGWLVVHAVDASGDVGEPVGNVSVDPGPGYRSDVPVPVEADARNGSGAVDLAAALHQEDGGAGFDPEDDPIVEVFGEPVVDRFPARFGGTRVYVGAETFSPQAPEAGSVVVRHVAADRSGWLVLSVEEDPGEDGGGEVLGSRAVDAGVLRNATVPVHRPEGLEAGASLAVQAILLEDDGDGELGPEDRPVEVGGSPVGSTLAVEWPGPPREGDQGASASGPTFGDLAAALAAGLALAGRRKG